MQSNNRLRELDFLRGIAILLVILNHQYLFQFTQNMGWIGVDLFFVLSGFLVSGLLFKEYLKFGNINPKLFLIRRGFKIYPIYYLFYILYITPKIIKNKVDFCGLLGDLTFTQNYVWGWGYAMVQSWSLAVEEHFYFALVFLFWLTLKNNNSSKQQQISNNKLSKTQPIIITIFILCFVLRIASNLYFPNQNARNTTMTHLRIDSLLAGVLIAYYYYFKKNSLQLFFDKHKIKLLILSFILISFTPFIDHTHSIFVKTIGFTMLYIAFSIWLIWFLFDKNINTNLDKFFTKKGVNIISKIGFSSYSIYIIHGIINYLFGLANNFVFHESLHYIFLFFATTTVSILLGIFMTTYIENYFLTLRNKKFPSRII